MKRTYPLIIEQGDEGLFGFFPDLPGLTVAGGTREEVVAAARDFLRDYLADFQQRGKPWPDATRAVGMELLDIEEADVRAAAARPLAR
jgi:predicted RNase H-like HicB family nuclease